jgi:hypothetical protein
MSRFLVHAIKDDTDKTVAGFTVDSQFITFDFFSEYHLKMQQDLPNCRYDSLTFPQANSTILIPV